MKTQFQRKQEEELRPEEFSLETQYPSLFKQLSKLQSVVEKCVRDALEFQIDGEYEIACEEVYDTEERDKDGKLKALLLQQMLSERPEIERIETDDENYRLIIARAYVNKDKASFMRIPTEKEIELMYAKHLLWLNDAGGEQADFSNCLLRDVDLSHQNWKKAVFENAKLVEVNLQDTDLSSAVCNGARFYNCDASGLRAEDSEWKGVNFYHCDLDNALFLHSNLSHGKLLYCSAVGATFQYCCIEGTVLGQNAKRQIYQARCIEEEECRLAAEQGIRCRAQF